jgi:hypothetical protein
MTLTRVPRRGERVRAEGHQGIFVVVRVDKVDGFVNLELWENPKKALRGLPFASIRLLKDEVDEIIERIA